MKRIVAPVLTAVISTTCVLTPVAAFADDGAQRPRMQFTNAQKVLGISVGDAPIDPHTRVVADWVKLEGGQPIRVMGHDNYFEVLGGLWWSRFHPRQEAWELFKASEAATAQLKLADEKASQKDIWTRSGGLGMAGGLGLAMLGHLMSAKEAEVVTNPFFISGAALVVLSGVATIFGGPAREEIWGHYWQAMDDWNAGK